MSNRKRCAISRQSASDSRKKANGLNHLLAPSALVISCALSGQGALAQDDGVASAQENQQDTIVVTARKREENLTDVPLSVTALSRDEINNLIIDDSEDIIRQIPGATLLASGPEALVAFALRGQGQARNGFSESATGLFRDGIYVAGGGFGGRNLSRIDYFDVQRVEVLRGPQGALYGRNALGGAINAVSVRPNTDEFGGFFDAEYSFEIDRKDFRGAVNIPLGENFAIRAGGYSYDQDKGFHFNPRSGNYVDQRNFAGARVSALFAPSDAFSLLVGAEYSDDSAPAFGNIAFNATEDPDPYTHPLTSEAYLEVEKYRGYAIAEGQFSWGSWRVAGSYTDRDGARLNEDLDHFLGLQDVVVFGQEVELFVNQSEDYEAYTTDFYVASDEDNRFTWLLGAEIIGFESDSITEQFGTTGFIAGVRAAMRDDAALENLTSYAAYGAFGYALSDRLDLGFEFRVQHDEKEFDFVRARNQPDSLSNEFDLVVSDSWTSFTPTVTLDYALSDNQTIYARFATGTRPGGFNAQIPPDRPDADDLLTYEPEYALSGELGWKGVLGPWRLAAAAYYIHNDDLQIVTAAAEGLATFVIRNIPGGNVFGFELEGVGSYDLGPGTLRTAFAAATNHGDYGDGSEIVFLGAIQDISGNRIAQTNDFNGNVTISYSAPLSSSLHGFVLGSGQFEYGGPDSPLNDQASPEFALFDARVGVRHDNFTLSFFAKNLTDKQFRFADLGANEFWTDGRVLGVTLRTRF